MDDFDGAPGLRQQMHCLVHTTELASSQLRAPLVYLFDVIYGLEAPEVLVRKELLDCDSVFGPSVAALARTEKSVFHLYLMGIHVDPQHSSLLLLHHTSTFVAIANVPHI